MSLFNNQAETLIESFSTDKKLAYGLYKNGLWRRIKTPLGHFTHKVKDMPDNLGLTKECEVNFERGEEIPKIPYTIYYEILEFYRKIYQEIKSEVYTCIVWDRVKKDFFIHVPKQTVSGAEVKFENETELFNNPNLVPYCDIHSHNTMNAFFSSGDVKDEVSGRFYGVIGNIDHEVAKHVFKVSYDRQFINQTAADIFDVEVAFLHEDSDYSIVYDDVILKVTERVKKVSSYIAPLPKKKSQAIDYGYTNLYLDYDYDDYDIESPLRSPNSNYYGTNPVDITMYTKLATKKNSPAYKLFYYDFQQVFNYTFTKPKEVSNLFNSLTQLILSEKIVLTEDTINTIICELYAILPEDSEL